MWAMIEKLRMRDGGVAPGGLGIAGTGCFLLTCRRLDCPTMRGRQLRAGSRGGPPHAMIGPMTTARTPNPDPRAVLEYRIPATDLRAGDLVNTSPGGDDDWQQVLSVHTRETPGSDAEPAALIREIGDRYVVVRLTDVAPVDTPVYFAEGAAFAYGAADGDDGDAVGAGGAGSGAAEGADSLVADVVSEPDAARVFLYTRYELVTVRS